MTPAPPKAVGRPPLQRVPWWGRLELRVIMALVVLGTLCVGASAYLVHLSIAFFDVRLERSFASEQEMAERIEPFHRALVEASIEGFEARAEAMALRFAFSDLEPSPGTDEARLEGLLEDEPDVVALVLERPDGRSVRVGDGGSEDEHNAEWFDVTAELPTPEGRTGGALRVVFQIDPEIDQRYQALGRAKRRLGAVQQSQDEIEEAVVRVVTTASAIVLLISIAVGLVVARSMTRKVSELSSVMARVGRGDLAVRSRGLGRDELGQLAHAFNLMLDELEVAQKKVSYLQRIGAWQDMARRIAHEIKNPLTPIALAVQQLKEKDPGLSPEFSRLLRTSVEIVEDEIAGLRRMVGSFSQFAKVPEVRLEPVPLRRVLEEFERAYGHLTDEERDELQVELPAPDVWLAGDRQLLKQALVNLVENAVLSAREAGRDPVRVRVSTRAGSDWVEVLVDDNGPGIEESRRERVFEPYETSREEGTGLGLPIVKKIVLDHGGEVWVQSGDAVGGFGGARFVLRFPRPATPLLQ